MHKKERRSKSKTVHTHVTEMYIMREMDRENDETTKRQSAIVLERRQKTASIRQRTKRISQRIRVEYITRLDFQNTRMYCVCRKNTHPPNAERTKANIVPMEENILQEENRDK